MIIIVVVVVVVICQHCNKPAETQPRNVQLTIRNDRMIIQSEPKISCCIAGCNLVNEAPMGQFKGNSNVRKLTKFPERCM